MLELLKIIRREVSCTEAAMLAGMSMQQTVPCLKRLARRGHLLVRTAEKKYSRYRTMQVSLFRLAGELSPDAPSWFLVKAVPIEGARRVVGRDMRR